MSAPAPSEPSASSEPSAPLATPAHSPALPLLLNGRPDTCAEGETVADLLGRLGLRRDGVAVALNGEVLPRSVWPDRALRAGDRVELIHAVGGG